MVRNTHNLRLSPTSLDDIDDGRGVYVGTGPESILKQACFSFLKDELGSYRNSTLVMSVYKSLLMNKDEYRCIFSTSEINLLFDDIHTIAQSQKVFLDKLLSELVSTGLQVDGCDGADDTETLQVDINSLLNRYVKWPVNLGRLFNECYSENGKFKEAAVGLCSKQRFVYQTLEEKVVSDRLASNWWTEANRLIKNQTSCANLPQLLNKAIDRIYGYPSQLKSIMDLSHEKYDLNIALIKVNKLLQQMTIAPKIHNWQQLQQLLEGQRNNRKNLSNLDPIVDNRLEYNVESEHEIKLEGSHAKAVQPRNKSSNFAAKQPKLAQLQPLITRLYFKTKAISDLQKTITRFVHCLETFTASQITYAHSWNELLRGDQFFDLVYEKYFEKLSQILVLTSNLQKLVDDRIMKPLAACLKHTRQIAAMCKRLEALHKMPFKKAQHKVYVIHQTVAEQLPLYIEFLNQFVGIFAVIFTSYVQQWLKLYIGKHKIKEYEESCARGLCTNHQDIVNYYLERTTECHTTR